MRISLQFLCLILVTATSGCGVMKELCRYTHEQVEYHEIVDDCLTTARVRMIAADSWLEFVEANPECARSSDYADGFKDGFTDYVVEGPGAPPIIPPRHYWTVCNQDSDGHQRAADWLEGFRAGVAAAQQSGCRACATVPAALDNAGPEYRPIYRPVE
jgi:hypothetical protein